jgi:valyl-tRNA synthetase
MTCQTDTPTKWSECDDTNLSQDPDCLDTWNSSWLWPFAVFDNEKDMDYYFPVDLVVTGIDILFFWVMKMMMASGYLYNKPPFKKVYFHGIVRDETNKKMSKSAGNALDPIEIIDKVGVDPMRFSMLMTAPKDGDLKISMQSFEVGKTFCTKIWNIARYLQMNEVFLHKNKSGCESDEIEDKSICKKLDNLVIEIEKSFDKMDFLELCQKIYNFVWNDFANDYLEHCKNKMNDGKKTILYNVFSDIIKILHPLLPHLTEEIWEIMGNQDLYIQQYPTAPLGISN